MLYPSLNQALILPIHQNSPWPNGNTLLHIHQAPNPPVRVHLPWSFWLEKLHSLLPLCPLNMLCVLKSCLHKMKADLRDMLHNHSAWFYSWRECREQRTINAGHVCTDGPETSVPPVDQTTALTNLSLHLQSQCTACMSSGGCSLILSQSKLKGR